MNKFKMAPLPKTVDDMSVGDLFQMLGRISTNGDNKTYMLDLANKICRWARDENIDITDAMFAFLKIILDFCESTVDIKYTKRDLDDLN